MDAERESYQREHGRLSDDHAAGLAPGQTAHAQDREVMAAPADGGGQRVPDRAEREQHEEHTEREGQRPHLADLRRRERDSALAMRPFRIKPAMRARAATE